MSFNKRVLGKNIRDLRTRLELTQEQFAEAIGVFQPHIPDFEKGNISIKNVARIIEVFKVNAEDLFAGAFEEGEADAD